MENIKIRLLKAEEIECRISTINERGLSLLLYKDARVDQRILDETFGALGWQRSHQCIEGNLYCTVAVYDKESGTWVAKQDVGTTGYTEKEKSQASDSFKRACFNWGIGRELYTAPFIWIPSGRAEIQKKGDRFICSDRFGVTAIGYSSDREIISLTIANSKGETVYELKEPAVKKSSHRKESITGKQMDSLKAELKRTGVPMEAVQERYKVQEPEQMPEELYKRIMSALARTKTQGAA